MTVNTGVSLLDTNLGYRQILRDLLANLVMHESMTSQKIKKLGAGGAKTFGGGPWTPPRWLRACQDHSK